MAFAITQNCCSDATCVKVCPVNCIHPTPEERAFGSTEMLHIDPKTCIDCGACSDACPIDAIQPVEALFGPERVYADINAAYFEGQEPSVVEPAGERTGPNFHAWGAPTFDRVVPRDFPDLDVAVVGTGPAGMYAVEDLVLHTPARVTLIDRLETTGGLVRYGVAPDHPATKKVSHTFARFLDHPRVTVRSGVEVGRDVSHDELLARHDAVVYAVGAPDDRRLGVPGEELAHAATRFVGWYNGHPDVPADAFSLDTERVVVVGMGNVALDVARILLSDPEALAGTSIAPHALAALRASRVREVVLVGRSDAARAAHTRNEMLGLRSTPGLEVVDDGTLSDAPGRRVVLRYETVTERVTADGLVTTAGDEIPAGLVLRAIGSRGVPTPGLPFDEDRAVVPHEGGRVTGMPGTYVVGWAKRGPSGGIGANRTCAQETVGTLLEDIRAGRVVARGKRRRRLLPLL